MKKILFTMLFGALYLYGFTYPILSRSTSGGFFGYSKTDSHLEDWEFTAADGSSYIKTGWVISCSGAGFTSCPSRASLYSPLNPGKDPDQVDMNTCGDLLDYADAQFETGKKEGFYTLKVQVKDEPFQRVYSLTWKTDVNGVTTTIIDKTEVILNTL